METKYELDIFFLCFVFALKDSASKPDTIYKWHDFELNSDYVYVPSTKTYNELVVKLLRTKYSIDDEFAVLRQQNTKLEEFTEYNEFAERCKTKVKEFLQIRDAWELKEI